MGKDRPFRGVALVVEYQLDTGSVSLTRLSGVAQELGRSACRTDDVTNQARRQVRQASKAGAARFHKLIWGERSIVLTWMADIIRLERLFKTALREEDPVYFAQEMFWIAGGGEDAPYENWTHEGPNGEPQPGTLTHLALLTMVKEGLRWG